MIFPDFRIFSKPWYKTIAFICLIFGRLLYGFWFFVCKSQTHKAGKTTVLRGDVATYSLDWNWVTPFTVHTDVGLGSQVSSGLPATVIKFTVWGILSFTTRIIRHRETSSFQLISSFLNVFSFFFFFFSLSVYKTIRMLSFPLFFLAWFTLHLIFLGKLLTCLI